MSLEWILESCHKEAVRTSDGKLFHAVGLATQKSPVAEMSSGTWNDKVSTSWIKPPGSSNICQHSGVPVRKALKTAEDRRLQSLWWQWRSHIQGA